MLKNPKLLSGNSRSYGDFISFSSHADTMGTPLRLVQCHF